jgi:hypothetical protein
MDWDRITAELEKKLDAKHVKPPKKFGPKGDYIESWLVQATANEIFGFAGWSSYNVDLHCVSEKPRKLGQAQRDGWAVTYVCTREIVVDGTRRQGTGAGHGYDTDLGMAHESAAKEAESDAEKRAFKSFGWRFGLALYDKEREHVETELTFNPRATADRILKAIAECTTKQTLRGLWAHENDALAALKEHAPPIYLEVKNAFAEAGKSAHDDPAMQAPPPDYEEFA